MCLKKIRLQNIRGFKELEIGSANDNGLPLHAVFIGANSTCKTTILRCIAIGLCDQNRVSALLSEIPGSLIGPTGMAVA
jgi:predicted ATP-dependent endonuclease of OLD family